MGLNSLRGYLPKSLVQEGRQLAIKIHSLQSVLVAVLACIFYFYTGLYAALSTLVGGLICVSTGIVFSIHAFRYSGASKNELVVRSFGKGNKLKFIFTIVLFFFVYQWVDLQPKFLLIGYVITLLAQWPIIIFISRVNRKS